MITFKCAKCAHAYRISEEHAGKKTRCKCGTAIVVPKPKTEAAGCGDTLARYNSLLLELLEYEKHAPALEMDSK